MVLTQDWLPIGSVVHVAGNEGLYFIIGYMQQTTDGAVWDYAARPYPMGYMGDDQDVYFDRDGVDGVYGLGLQNIDGDQWQNYLTSLEPEYDRLKARVMSGESLGDIRAERAAARETGR